MTITGMPLRVAIVGAGPSGFYAAEALQKSGATTQIDLYDRLPTPYGLVRGGVAPDHPKIKSVTRIFDRIASQPGFRYVGNVTVGRQVTPGQLRENYDAVLYAVGAQTDRRLGIPGEDLPGSHAATELVGWYNGQPDFRDAQFDLGVDAVAVIGLGNVAMDVTRILMRDPAELAVTDLTSHAIADLSRSKVSTVHVIGRRGPVQGAFTTPELRELGALAGVDVMVNPTDLVLDPTSAEHLSRAEDRNLEKNLEVLREWALREPTGAARRIVLHFCTSPVAIVGSDRVSGLRVVRNRLESDGRGGVRAVPGTREDVIQVGMVLRSVGYRGVAIDGLPFDDDRGVIPNAEGRVVEHPGSHTYLNGVYACGWIKRGPSGVIGTNKVCASQTIDHMLADAVTGRINQASGSPDQLLAELSTQGARVTTWQDWQQLDAVEVGRGEPLGKPREKLTRIEEMISHLGDTDGGDA